MEYRSNHNVYDKLNGTLMLLLEVLFTCSSCWIRRIRFSRGIKLKIYPGAMLILHVCSILTL